MKRNVLCSSAALPLLMCLSSAAAYADTIDFILTSSAQTVSPGGTLSFSATVSAPLSNTTPVYLNGDTFTISSPLSLDDTPFFLNFPFFLDPGDSDTDVLFTIAVPLSTAAANYPGSFTLQGGADATAQNVLGSDPFTVDVTSATTITVSPEPSSWLLCASGILGLSALLRKRFISR